VGGGAGAAAAEGAPAPSGKTGWEALDKWVSDGAEKPDKAGTIQERAAELKDDLAKLREELPMEEIQSTGKGFIAALKKFFSGK
jgi:hypothetical protein